MPFEAAGGGHDARFKDVLLFPAQKLKGISQWKDLERMPWHTLCFS